MTLRDIEAMGIRGLSFTHVFRVETGERRASPSVTDELAKVLQVDVAYLTGQLPPVRAVREALGRDAREFATSVGITHRHLERIEQGSEQPTPALLDMIAVRLGVDPDLLRLQDAAA